jgi:hypothetical protein
MDKFLVISRVPLWGSRRAAKMGVSLFVDHAAHALEALQRMKV